MGRRVIGATNPLKPFLELEVGIVDRICSVGCVSLNNRKFRHSTRFQAGNHWNQKVGWIARGFPQQGFGPPASYYSIILQHICSIKINVPHISSFIWFYLNLFDFIWFLLLWDIPGVIMHYISYTSYDKQLCFKSFRPGSWTFDNTRKYDNNW